jgi:hypothetical protein
MFFLESNIIIAVLPFDCVEDNIFLKNLISISYITVRVKTVAKSEAIEAKIEQKSRTNVETIKSVCYLIEKKVFCIFLIY